MKLILITVSSCLFLNTVQAGQTAKKSAAPPAATEPARTELKTELNAIRDRLADVKKRAEKDSDVMAAHEDIDEAFRNYYETLRAKMLALDPQIVPLLDRERELRLKLNSQKPEKHAVPAAGAK